MSLTQLEYIVAVAREKNFRKAAKTCFVTQPTLSAQIQKYEDVLGVLIFDRSKNPIIPTRIGEEIIHQAKIVLKEVREIQEIISRDKGVVKGEVRIGVIPTISPYLLPLFLNSLYKKYPDLELNILEKTTPECLLALNNEEIDVAILATPENQKAYYQEMLYKENLDLYINLNHPFAKKNKVKVGELKSNEIWLLEEGHCLRDEILSVCRFRSAPKSLPHNLNLKIGSLESIRYLVSENFGYTLLPHSATMKLSKEEQKQIRPLYDPVPFRTVNLTYSRVHVKKAAIAALKEMILKNLPQGFEQLV